MKLPAFQFYPGDWMKDPNLRRCTHAAKGVWIDILCLMWENDERGVLATDGKPWSDADIALATGGDRSVVIACLEELTLKGVANRRSDGGLYSKRMVRDEHKRALCREAGKRGGNPNLTATLKGGSKGEVNGQSKGHANPKPTPSSSSSSSSSDKEPPDPHGGDSGSGGDKAAAVPERLRVPAFLDVWAEWQVVRRRMKACKDFDRLFRHQLEFLEKFGVDGAIESLKASIRNGWQGLFRPDQGQGSQRGKQTPVEARNAAMGGGEMFTDRLAQMEADAKRMANGQD